MSHGPLARSMETVNVFRERLNSLDTLCAQVARQQGAQAERGVSVQEPFNAQMSTGSTAELPVFRMAVSKLHATRPRSTPTCRAATTPLSRSAANCSARAALIRLLVGPTLMIPPIRAGMPERYATNRRQSTKC